MRLPWFAHREGDLHIHDLDILAGYGAWCSLRMLLLEGLNGVVGEVGSLRMRTLGPSPLSSSKQPL
jgi:hypothetical protein